MTFSSLSNKINFLIKIKKGCVKGLQCTTIEYLWLLEPSSKAALPGCLCLQRDCGHPGTVGRSHHPAPKRLSQEDLKFKASLGCILRPASKGIWRCLELSLINP